VFCRVGKRESESFELGLGINMNINLELGIESGDFGVVTC